MNGSSSARTTPVTRAAPTGASPDPSQAGSRRMRRRRDQGTTYGGSHSTARNGTSTENAGSDTPAATSRSGLNTPSATPTPVVRYGPQRPPG